MEQQNNGQAVLPRRSRRLATIIPASHWTSMGYSEFDGLHLQRLQLEIKLYCDGRNDTIFSSIPTEINIRGRPGRDILSYHELMLPHWQKLLKTLHGRTHINTIKILGISLPVPVLDIMFPTFHSINLVTLTLFQTGLGIDGLLKLSCFIKDSASIKNLTIGGTFNLSVARSLSAVVKDHPSLEMIGFLECGLNNVAILEKILAGCRTIMQVSIVKEEFSSEAVDLLADFIRGNHHTEVIQFGHSSLSDSDVVVLASALKMNTNLRLVDLRRNNYITEGGEKALLKALYDPTSMDSIVESNHTCMAYTHDYKKPAIVAQRPPIEKEVLIINKQDALNIQQKIRKKLVLALCCVDGSVLDLSHLNDLPLQLMPRVLELIQKHTDARTRAVQKMPLQLKKDALSRLFHTLRGWELPSLFENLGSPSAKRVSRKRRKTRR